MTDQKRLIFPILVILALGALGSYIFNSQSIEVETISVESLTENKKKAHDFRVQSHQGKWITLESFKGQPILLHFWASWCAPCLKEIPDLIGFAERNEDSELRILLISLDDKWEDSYKVWDPKGLPKNVTYTLDSKQEVSDRYGSYQFPETFLLNRKHEIVTKWIGAQKWNSADAVEALKKFYD